ncbi:hypothetical protein B0H63DRAFT_474630 [Podospora didyma]|uniref:Monooxygenase n=1 Tax=Podospora didyma TaxID=330526 RepID=A0AAE0TVC8_9PEZI|nr:hypothetical protein B0H63DRAFT_474630 [Podospora didyma]
MAPSDYVGIGSPSKERHPGPPDNLITGLIKDSFSFPTLLVIGALGQTALMLVLPPRYALLPAVALLVRAITTTVLAVRNNDPATNYAIIPGRTSTVLPRETYDPAGTQQSPFDPLKPPASRGIVVLHLGARFNHPLGPLAPGAKQMGDHFTACNKRVLAEAKKFGCLGNTFWTANDSASGSNNTFMNVYYFRDVEGLNAFAHDEVHRAAWDWYTGEFVRKLGYTHLGVFHETFYAAPGAHEAIYVNMQPTLLGATSVLTRNEATGEDEWVQPLVKGGNHALLRSQYSRMGRVAGEKEGEKGEDGQA